MYLVLGVLLAIVEFFVTMPYWLIQRKKRYLRKKMNDEEFLTTFIAQQNTEKNFVERTELLEPIGFGFFQNIHLVAESTLRADRVISIGSFLLGAAIVVVGLFQGYSYAVAYLIAFFLASVVPIGSSGVRNALSDILHVALILHKWNIEDEHSCKNFVADTHSLSKLYSAVRTVTEQSKP